MGRVSRKNKIRTGWPRGTIFQLCVGWDFFHDGLENDREALRDAWRDPAMRQAVYDRQALRGVGGPPWAETEFGV